MTTEKKFSTKYMVEMALMIAIILVMTFTPLGYIRTPGLEITLLTIPVAVGAIILGPAGGAVCGLAFGLTSFYQCFGMSPFGAMLLTINPIFTLIVCVVPRLLDGWLCGLIFAALQRMKTARKISCYVTSLLCPVLNTVFFMGSIVLLFYRTDYIQGFVTSFGVKNPFTFILAFVGVQGLIEAILCFAISSVVSRALIAALKRT